jgi:hypothetical protein
MSDLNICIELCFRGYFRIRRGVDECGIEDQVVANSGKWHGPGIQKTEEVVV